jgi:LCP family protein required for cell wall assembly
MKKIKLRYFLLFDVFVALIALAFVSVAMWNRPLGPSLAQSLDPTQQADTPTSWSNSNNNTNNNNVPISQSPTSTPGSLLSQITSLVSPKTVKTLCGGPQVMYILMLGSDQRGTNYAYGLADAIRLVRVDFVNPSVMMLDFPRDLWVEIPGISAHYDITHAKLNQAYFFGAPSMGYYDGPGGGPGLMAQTLKLNFGAQVDHYLVMNMSSFVNLVDTIGGVDIYLNSTVDMNPDHDGANPEKVFEAGYLHLDGTQALAFARNRIPTTFQRARYQTLILNSLASKLLSPNMIPVWPQIIDDFSNLVQTDLSPNEISQLACLAKNLNKDNITTVAFPDTMFTSEDTYDPYRQVYTFTFAADLNQIRAYVADFMNGVWP